MKNSFIVYTDNTEYIDILSDEQLGQLYKAQILYSKGIDPEIEDITVKALFSLFRGQLDRDNEKYQNKVERVKKLNETKSSNKNTTSLNKNTISSRNRNDIVGDTVTDTVTDTDTDTVTDTVTKKKTAKRFVPPTIDEVRAYCIERGNSIDANHFVDYYEANGWKVGKNPMKDWKACVRTWEQRETRAAPADKYAEIDRQFLERYKDDTE